MEVRRPAGGGVGARNVDVAVEISVEGAHSAQYAMLVTPPARIMELGSQRPLS